MVNKISYNMTKKDYDYLVLQIEDEKQDIAKQIIKELLFIDKTLKELKKIIKKDGVIENFKNGSQEFTRESPALKSYNTTIQRYSMLYKQLIDLIPKTEGKKEGSPVYDFIDEE